MMFRSARPSQAAQTTLLTQEATASWRWRSQAACLVVVATAAAAAGAAFATMPSNGL